MNTKTTEEGRLRARKEVRIDHQSRALTAVFIAGFPILIIFISRLFSRHRDLHDPQSAEMSNYQTFPWLGIYMYTLALNARKGFTPFLFSILSFVVLFYCMFLTAVLIWNELLFKKSFPNGITDKFYTLVAYFEVLNLLFIRTRSSIKYFPIGIMTILFFWSFYFQVAIYPFAFISLYLATSACATVFCYLIVYFEIPALTWNPNHTYTPSVHKPRQVFFPAFSLNWVHDLPQFWNMFFPLWGRGQFTNNQLALVDNDMGLLNNTLQNANNLNIGSADDEQLMNHLDLQAAAAPPSSPSPRIQECSTKGSAASRQMFSSQLQYPFAPQVVYPPMISLHYADYAHSVLANKHSIWPQSFIKQQKIAKRSNPMAKQM
eukprot:TRINITY_DN1861_c0_g1_i4.p1 TRINITY_DN1861_c0_g1~~TRINITY_DN1861_c0_g1_i4.p1  ORF type:complete len:375 (-),score=56.49 TRINITY_DN1861_c0_g1_i4:431-1555(-)